MSRKPSARDVEIGRDLARLRKATGVSQAELAAALGISTQQVGKYERGENRISTARHEQAQEALRIASVVAQPGLAEEMVAYRAGDPRVMELEEAALAIRQAVENFLSIARRRASARSTGG